MQKSIMVLIRQCLERNRNKRIYRMFIQILCCMVVFVTTYALILPAITMEQDTFCGHEAHVHTDDCLQPVQVSVLVCTPDSLGIHTHSGSCYNADGVVICGQADYVVHSHSDSCYDTAGQLVCLLTERSSHVHGDSCYIPGETQPEILHVHSEACYIREKGELTCAEEEWEGHSHDLQCYGPGDTLECRLTENHVHDASCYSLPLTCSLATDPHVHVEGCYGTGNLRCTMSEYHSHTDSCWERILSCGAADETHCHDDGCYTAILRCQVPEDHAHSGSCYEKIRICGKEDGQTHEHTDSCYGGAPKLHCLIPENHVHDSDCYNRIQICELPEDPGHRHEDICYQWNSVLNCGLEEGQPEPTEPPEPILACVEPEIPVHNHGDSCFELQEKICQGGEDHQHTENCYSCGLEEHEHTLICFSDPEADVESAAIWEASFAHVALTGDWPTDVVAIAESQLGYSESGRNYEVWEDNSLHGYTRYGAWYGVPYGDWCGMFASFCLHYAEVEGMPYHYGVRPWIEALSRQGLYYSAKETKPQKGNLIFFDWDADGLSDHVGIVAEVQEPQEHTGASVKTIEGNSGNVVRYQHYDPNDSVILGYGLLPGQARIPVAIVESDDVPGSLLEILICGIPAHSHGEICYSADGTGICNLDEHVHTIDCVDPSVPIGYADGGTKLRMLGTPRADTNITYHKDISSLLTSIAVYNSKNELVWESENKTGLGQVTVGENCRILLTFAETDRKQFSPGNTDILTYQIPANLAAEVVGTGVIRNRNNTIVAAYEIVNDQLRITPVLVNGRNFFGDFNNVSLSIEFDAEVEHDLDSTSTQIDFNGKFKVSLIINEDTKLDAEKHEISYDPETQTISYLSTVTVYGGNNVPIDTISDWWWPDNASVVEGSIQLKDKDGNLYNMEDWDLTYNNNGFELHPKIPVTLSHKETITLTYQVKIDDGITENFDLTNEFYSYSGNNGNKLEDTDIIVTPVIVTNVEKTGIQEKEEIDGVQQDVLKWTTKIDNPYLEIIEITDSLGAGQVFCTHRPISVRAINQNGTVEDLTINWTDTDMNDAHTQFVATLPTLIFSDDKNEYKAYEVIYYSHFQWSAENPEFETFENTVQTNIKIGNKFTSSIGSVGAIGVPYGIQKTALSEDFEWVTFTVNCIMPGTLYGRPNVLLYDSLGSWGTENSFIQLDPDSMQITVTPEGGTAYQLQPYTNQESADNTYLLVKNGPEFTLYFNTKQPDPATSVWKCSANATVSISYRVSRHSQMLLFSEGGYATTGETLNQFLERTGQIISNYAKLDYAPGYSIDTTATYDPPHPETSPLTKTAEIAAENDAVQDGVYNYSVLLDTTTGIFSPVEGDWIYDIQSLTLTDTFDSRMEYVLGTFMVKGLSCWNEYEEFVFSPGTAPKIEGSTITVNAHDLKATKTYLQGQSLVDVMKIWTNGQFEFVYQLRVKETIKQSTTEGVLLLDNTATLSWTNSHNRTLNRSAEHQVEYDTGILQKNMDIVDDSNVVEFTILVNHNGLDLAPDADSYVLYDKMSSNLVLLYDTISVEVLDDENGDTPAVLSLMDCQFVYDPEANQMTFVLPDEKVIQLSYQCMVTGVGGTTAEIENEVNLLGSSTVQDVVSTTFQIKDHQGSADSSNEEFYLMKQDGNNHRALAGVTFRLYGDTMPSENQDAADFTLQHESHTHHMYEYGTFTTGADGIVRIQDTQLSAKHLYMLEEVMPPEGYVALPEGYWFYMIEPELGASMELDCIASGQLVVIENYPIGYELPATGGSGSEQYTVAGWLLMMAAVILLYNQGKCRKEDVDSS